MCAVLFGHLFACKVLGTCSDIWFLGIFGMVLCPGIAGGLSGVFLGDALLIVGMYGGMCLCVPYTFLSCML